MCSGNRFDKNYHLIYLNGKYIEHLQSIYIKKVSFYRK